jgi:hypothetical protein
MLYHIIYISYYIYICIYIYIYIYEIIRDLVAAEEGVTAGGYGHPPCSVARDVVGNERPTALIMHKDSLAFVITQQDK